MRAEIDLEQPLDQQRLKHAVQEVGQVIPQLMKKYEMTDNKFVDVGFTIDDVLHFVDEFDESAAGKLNWEKQAQWQLYLSKKKLVIYGSHILTDGAGFKELLYLLCQAYNQPGSLDMNNHQDIEGIKELLAKIPAKQSQQNDHATKALYLPKLVKDSGSEHYQVISQSLSSSEFGQIHQYAKQAGFTLYDVFLAAFCKAVQQLCGVDEISMAYPTDMRQYLPKDQQSQLRVQNLTGRYNITVQAPLTESIQDTIASVHQAMVDEKQRHSFLNSFRSMLAKLDQGASLKQLQAQVQQNYHVRDIAYTNMAIVDDQRLRFSGSSVKNCLLSGGFRQMPRYQICVSTYCQRLNLVANVIATDQEKQLAWAVMSLMKMYLLSLQ